MKVLTTGIEGLKILEPDLYGDAKSWFCETHDAERYRALGRYGVKTNLLAIRQE